MPSNSPIPQVNPDDYPNRACCGWLEHMQAHGYVYPYRPVEVIGGHLDEGGKVIYGLAFYQQDPRTMQPLTNRDVIILQLPHCPFCGAKING